MSPCNDVTKSADTHPDAENLSRSSTSLNASSRKALQSFICNASKRRSQLSAWKNVLHRQQFSGQSQRSSQINPGDSPLPSPGNPKRPIEQVFNEITSLKAEVVNLGENLLHINRTCERHFAEENRNNVIDHLKERDERAESVGRKFEEISAAVENLTEFVRDQRTTISINELNQHFYEPKKQFLFSFVLLSFSVACLFMFKKV